MDRPVSLMPLTPADAELLTRIPLLLVVVVVLALLATAFVGLPDLALPVLDVGVDPAGALAPPF
jgi:hypothetical protein